MTGPAWLVRMARRSRVAFALLALTCALTIPPLMAPNATRGKTMEENYEFSAIHRLSGSSGDSTLTFETDGGRKAILAADASAAPTIQFARRAFAEHKTIFVGLDSAGACRFLAPIVADTVRALRPETGSIEVTLTLRPSYMRLNQSHPRFSDLKRVLEQALASQQPIWVGAFPGSADILDARPAPK